MNIRTAEKNDINNWMNFVDKVKDVFPGLETEEALLEHKNTVLNFMEKGLAVCAEEDGKIIGTLLFLKDEGQLCFLAVNTAYRRRHTAEKMVKLAMEEIPENIDVTVTTYREGDPEGVAARAFYKSLGFEEGALKEEFGSPVQEFVLRGGKRRNIKNKILIREYNPSDCKRITELFYDTVHKINIKDYDEKQIEAWAGQIPDASVWNRSFLEHFTVVAVMNGEITGFGDMDKNGYLDRLYVDSGHQREGIGKAICDSLENGVKAKEYTTFASVTAKPFFESRGYTVERENTVIRQGIELKNYFMTKKANG